VSGMHASEASCGPFCGCATRIKIASELHGRRRWSSWRAAYVHSQLPWITRLGRQTGGRRPMNRCDVCTPIDPALCPADWR
jgi:hypothetical protein